MELHMFQLGAILPAVAESEPQQPSKLSTVQIRPASRQFLDDFSRRNSIPRTRVVENMLELLEDMPPDLQRAVLIRGKADRQRAIQRVARMMGGEAPGQDVVTAASRLSAVELAAVISELVEVLAGRAGALEAHPGGPPPIQ
jgi:hypothetical protein